MMPLIIVLPWPASVLHPNSRGHWAQKARAAKKARKDGWAAALESGLGRIQADSLAVTVVFHPPNNRRRDADGMLSSVKSHLDGIADAVGVDDSRWSIAIRREEPRFPGSVHIEIQPVKVAA